MADQSKSYLINIVVKALNQARKGIDDAASGIEKLTAAEKKHAEESERFDKQRVKSREQSLRGMTDAERRFANEESRRKAKQETDQLGLDRAISKSVAGADAAFKKSADSRERETDRIGTSFFRMAQKVGRAQDALKRSLQKVGGDDAGSLISRGFNKLDNVFERNRDSVAKLDNQLRGLLTLGVIFFAQQLITVLGALGGAFVAVASSAAVAGAGIAAAMTSAAAQAVPAIGLIIAAFGRIGAVFDAVKQANKLVTAGAKGASDALEQQRNAANRVRDAHEALLDAQRRAREAQRGLTDARREARRELQDLADAELEARLAAEASILTLDEARHARRRAIAEGDAEGLARAELGVQEAGLGVSQAQRERGRTAADAGRARRGGVEGSDTFRSALQQVEESERAVRKARRNLVEARHDAENAGQAAAGAASQLNALLAQLTPAERRLYEALRRIQETYTRIFRPITDIIVGAFTRAVNRVEKVLGDQRIVGPFTKLAGAIGKAMDRVSKVLTSSGVLDFFARMTRESAKSIGPITSIALNLFKLFRHIAVAGIPAFRILLRFFNNLTESWAKGTSDRRSLSRFFAQGARWAIDWFKLGGAIIELFAALAGAGGAKTGTNIIHDLTGTVREATAAVDRNKESVAEFFEDSRKVLGQIGRVLKALGAELVRSFDPDAVEAFADILITVFIPALGIMIRTFGAMAQTAAAFLDLPFVSEIAKLVAVLGFGAIAFTKLGGAIILFLKPLISMVGWLARTRIGWALLTRVLAIAGSAATGPIALVTAGIAAAATIVALFVRRFGILKAVIINVVGGPFRLLIMAVALVLDKLGVLDNVLDAVKDAVIAVGRAFAAAGKWIGRAAGNVLEAVVGAFRSVLRFLGRLPGRVAGLIADAARSMWRGFRGVGSKVLDVLRDGFEAVWDFFKKMPERLLGYGKDAAQGFVKGMKSLPKVLFEALKGLGTGAINLAKTLARLIDDALPDKIALPGLPDVNLPDNPLGDLGAYRGGGMTGGYAMLSPGELAVDPSGRAAIVPGQPTAADNVLAYLKQGTSIITGHGQALMSQGASVAQALVHQLPHFGRGGYVQGAQEPRGEAGKHMRAVADFLFSKGFSATSGGEYRGSGTLHDAQQATDWGDSVNNLQRLWTLTYPFRAKMNDFLGPTFMKPGGGLYDWGTKYSSASEQANHQDHIHLGIQRAIAGLTGRGAQPSSSDRATPDRPSYRSEPIYAPLFKSVPRAARRAISRLQGVGFPGNISTPIGRFGTGITRDIQNLSQGLREDLAAKIKVGTRKIRVDTNSRSSSGSPTGGNLDRIFPAHGLGEPGARLSRNQVSNLIKRAGVASRDVSTMTNIAERESGRHPGIVASDRGIGLWQMTRWVQGALGKQWIDSLGGETGMRNPWHNAQVAFKMWKNRRFGDWDASAPSGGYRRGGVFKVPRFQQGGIFKKGAASAIPFTGATQLDVVGLILDQLREVSRVSRILTRTTLRKARNLPRAINNMSTTFGIFFEALTARLENLRTDAATALTKATFAVSKTGDFIRRKLSPEQVAAAELQGLQDEYRLLLGERGILSQRLRDARYAIRLARKRGDEKGVTAAKAAETTVLNQIRELDSGIADTITSIAEAAEAALASAIDQVNNQSERVTTRLDLANRVADVFERGGLTSAAFGIRGATLQSRGEVLRGQQGALQQLATQAFAQGNFDTFLDLTAQVEELGVQMLENTEAIRANTNAAREAAINAITERGGFLGGVFGGLDSLLQALAANTGVIDVNRQKDLLTQAMGVLTSTGAGLRDQLFAWLGIDLRGLDPLALTDTLRNLNFDAIEASLTVEERGTFESLISAIIENATATQQSTTAIKGLTAATTQDWTSTAWQWFRDAIFTGSGGLLPQFQVPSAQVGAMITSDGLVLAHQGEEIKPAGVSSHNGSGDIFAPTIEVTEQVEEANADVIANRLMFHYKTRK